MKNRPLLLLSLILIVLGLCFSYFAYQTIQHAGWERYVTRWVGDRFGFLSILIVAFLLGGLVVWEFLRTMFHLPRKRSALVSRIYSDTFLVLMGITLLVTQLNDYNLGNTEKVIERMFVFVMMIALYSLERIFGGWDKLVDRWVGINQK